MAQSRKKQRGVGRKEEERGEIHFHSCTVLCREGSRDTVSKVLKLGERMPEAAAKNPGSQEHRGSISGGLRGLSAFPRLCS